MAETKTKFTTASVDEYIASRASEQQQADCRELLALFSRITGHEPRMFGPSIVGFDTYRYVYDSGHSGEAPVLGFAIRGRELVAYIDAYSPEQQTLLGRLGKHKMGKSCLYFKKLSDLDAGVFEELVTNSVAETKRRYG